MDKQRDFVLRTIEERGVKFVRLWFTDVIGTLKSVAIAPAEVEGAFSEGPRLRRLGDRGSDPLLRVGPARPPRPDDVPDPAVARRDRPDRAHVLRHHDPRRTAGRGRPAPRAEALARQGGRRRLHVLHAPRDRVLPAEVLVVRTRGPRAGRLRRLLRQRPRRHRARLPPALGADARGPRHLGRVQPPRGRARPERDRPALRRRAGHGRQHHDVPHRDQRGRDRAGRLRDVHAEAPRRQARQRHAHAHVAVRGRRQRVLRRGRAPTSSRKTGRHFIAGLLRHAERDLRRDEPVRQLLQAPVGR